MGRRLAYFYDSMDARFPMGSIDFSNGKDMDLPQLAFFMSDCLGTIVGTVCIWFRSKKQSLNSYLD